MNSKIITANLVIGVVPVQTNAMLTNGPLSYLLGSIIALFIMGYLVYTLLKPEKF